MPIYEYRCRGCGRKSSLFIRSIGAPADPRCGHCQSPDVERALSSFAYHRSATGLHRDSGPRSGSGSGAGVGAGAASLDYYEDPRNIGRHVERSFERHGVEMPSSVRDTIDAARDGHVPEGLDL